MQKSLKTPMRLYKYRPFNARTVDMLVADQVYFADPSTFNDPLDTKPCVKADIPVDALEASLQQLIVKRVSAEMSNAAKTMKFGGVTAADRIAKLSSQAASQQLANVAYFATDPDYAARQPQAHQWLLAQELQKELLLQYDKGVLSLAERYACPLMWSHYGDQHHGLCIGYSVPEMARKNLYKVRYGGSRIVEASKIAEMLEGDEVARSEVDSAVLSLKARDWRYEKEWRLLGSRGLTDSPLELTDITFGTRCSNTVMHTVAKSLEDRTTPVKFYQMTEPLETFTLKRVRVNTEELGASYPRCWLSILEAFEDEE